MARIGLLHRIDRQEPDRIHRFLNQGGVGRGGGVDGGYGRRSDDSGAWDRVTGGFQGGADKGRSRGGERKGRRGEAVVGGGYGVAEGRSG